MSTGFVLGSVVDSANASPIAHAWVRVVLREAHGNLAAGDVVARVKADGQGRFVARLRTTSLGVVDAEMSVRVEVERDGEEMPVVGRRHFDFDVPSGLSGGAFGLAAGVTYLPSQVHDPIEIRVDVPDAAPHCCERPGSLDVELEVVDANGAGVKADQARVHVCVRLSGSSAKPDSGSAGLDTEVFSDEPSDLLLIARYDVPAGGSVKDERTITIPRGGPSSFQPLWIDASGDIHSSNSRQWTVQPNNGFQSVVLVVEAKEVGASWGAEQIVRIEEIPIRRFVERFPEGASQGVHVRRTLVVNADAVAGEDEFKQISALPEAAQSTTWSDYGILALEARTGIDRVAFAAYRLTTSLMPTDDPVTWADWVAAGREVVTSTNPPNTTETWSQEQLFGIARHLEAESAYELLTHDASGCLRALATAVQYGRVSATAAVSAQDEAKFTLGHRAALVGYHDEMSEPNRLRPVVASTSAEANSLERRRLLWALLFLKPGQPGFSSFQGSSGGSGGRLSSTVASVWGFDNPVAVSDTLQQELLHCLELHLAAGGWADLVPEMRHDGGNVRTIKDILDWSADDWNAAVLAVGTDWDQLVANHEALEGFESMAEYVASRIQWLQVRYGSYASSDVDGTGDTTQDLIENFRKYQASTNSGFDFDSSVVTRKTIADYLTGSSTSMGTTDQDRLYFGLLQYQRVYKFVAMPSDRFRWATRFIDRELTTTWSVLQLGRDALVGALADKSGDVDPDGNPITLSSVFIQEHDDDAWIEVVHECFDRAATVELLASQLWAAAAPHGRPVQVGDPLGLAAGLTTAYSSATDDAGVAKNEFMGEIEASPKEYDPELTVFSPGAYLLDLLFWVKTAGLWTDGLKLKRADLEWIALSTPNSKELVPYVDLAIEVLERAVLKIGDSNHQGLTAMVETAGSFDDRRAWPQSVNADDAYAAIALATPGKTVWPYALPYDARAEQARFVATSVGVSRADVMETLRTSDQAGDIKAIGLERAGLDAGTWSVISVDADQGFSTQYWGQAGSDLASETQAIQKVLYLARAWDLSAEAVEARMRLRCLNPANGLTIERGSGANASDVTTWSVRQATEQDLTLAQLHRLHVFGRLLAALPWTDRDVDVLMSALGATITNGVVGMSGADIEAVLGDVRWLENRTGLSASALASWVGDLDTHRFDATDTDLASEFGQVYLQDEASATFALASWDESTFGVRDLVSSTGTFTEATAAELAKALGTTATDAQALLARISGSVYTDATTDLATVSAAHRHVGLAQALGLSLADLLLLLDLTQDAPFTSFAASRAFIEQWDRLSAFAATPERLAYFVDDGIVAEGRHGSVGGWTDTRSQEVLTRLIVTLRSEYGAPVYPPDWSIGEWDEVGEVWIWDPQRFDLLYTAWPLPGGVQQTDYDNKADAILKPLKTADINGTDLLSALEAFLTQQPTSVITADRAAQLAREVLYRHFDVSSLSDPLSFAPGFDAETTSASLATQLHIEFHHRVALLAHMTGALSSGADPYVESDAFDDDYADGVSLYALLADANLLEADTPSTTQWASLLEAWRRATRIAILRAECGVENLSAADATIWSALCAELSLMHDSELPLTTPNAAARAALLAKLDNALSLKASRERFALASEIMPLAAFAELAATEPDLGTVQSELAAYGAATAAELQLASSDLGHTAGTDLRSAATLRRVFEFAELARRLGASSAALTAGWREPSPTLSQLASMLSAADAKLGLLTAPSTADWQDVHRIRRRDALAWFVANDGDKDVAELVEDLLIDPLMDPCDNTTRVREAIDAVHQYVQQVSLRKAGLLRLTPEQREEWRWMGNYRLWEAARKVQLYPEEWMRAELRDDRTELFEEALRGLRGPSAAGDAAEEVYRRYLDGYKKLGSLKPLGYSVAQNQKDPYLEDALFLVGTTQGDEPEYFWRSRTQRAVWSGWEKLPATGSYHAAYPVRLGREDRVFLIRVERYEEPADEGQPTPYEYPKHTAYVVHVDSTARGLDGWGPLTPACRPVPVRVQVSKPTMDFVGLRLLGPWTAPDGTEQTLSLMVGEVVRVDGDSKRVWKKLTWNRLFDRFEPGSGGLPKTYVGRIPRSYRVPLNHHIRTAEGSTITSRTRDARGRVRSADHRLEYFDEAAYSWMVPGSVWSPLVELTGLYTPSTSGSGFGVLLTPLYNDDQGYDPVGADMTYAVETLADEAVPVMLDAVRDHGLRFLLDAPDTAKHEWLSRQRWEASTGAGQSILSTELAPTAQRLKPSISGLPSAATGLYHWELFFHLPIAIAQHLRSSFEFEDALRWLEVIVDPAGANEDLDDTAAGESESSWKFRPFMRTIKEAFDDTWTALTGSKLAGPHDARSHLAAHAAAVASDPFNPFRAGRMRPYAFQRWALGMYVDTLIEWGDHLFKQDTRSSVRQAFLLYNMAELALGKRPDLGKVTVPTSYTSFNGLESAYDSGSHDDLTSREAAEDGPMLRAAALVTTGGVELSRPAALALLAPRVHGNAFGVPATPGLTSRWDRVADRLFKIRHCMNLEGTVRTLALFAPPIDPAALVAAATAGVSPSAVLSSSASSPPTYRYSVLLAKSKELVGVARGLARDLQSALEKGDGEHLAVLNTESEIRLSEAQDGVWELRKAEADYGVASSDAARESAQTRFDHYDSLIEEGELGLETNQVALTIAEGALQTTAGVLSAIKAPISAMDTLLAGGKPSGPISAITLSLNASSSVVSTVNRVSALYAGWERRKQDWELQRDTAEHDKAAAEANWNAAKVRSTMSSSEFANHKLARDESKTRLAFYTSKFSREELYTYLADELQLMAYEAYELAFEVAKKAERAMQYELGLPTSQTYVSFASWSGTDRGLLAADRLQADLNRMDQAHMELNKREYELTKHVQLSQLDPYALESLRIRGEAVFAVGEAWFDLDHPGHYFRRLKSVSMSIPCIIGRYGNVNAKLTLLRSEHRKSTDLDASSGYAKSSLSDSRFHVDRRVESIATSSAQDDAGLFQVNFEDPRLLPFERRGAVSVWKLELTDASPQFNYGTISDVVLHLKYTSREGGETFKGAVVNDDAVTKQGLKEAINQLSTGLAYDDARFSDPDQWADPSRATAPNGYGFMRVLRASQHLPQQWHAFLHNMKTLTLGADPTGSAHELAIPLDEMNLLAGLTPAELSLVQVGFRLMFKDSTSYPPSGDPRLQPYITMSGSTTRTRALLKGYDLSDDGAFTDTVEEGIPGNQSWPDPWTVGPLTIAFSQQDVTDLHNDYTGTYPYTQDIGGNEFGLLPSAIEDAVIVLRFRVKTS